MAGGRRVRVDIAFPRWKVAVFVDGCFWHKCPAHGTEPKTNSHYWRTKLTGNVERDALVSNALVQEGWTVVHVWEHVPPDQAADHVSTVIEATRSDC